jgi:GT2 family glycosyltransferase
VIIPTYNRARLAVRAVESVLAQDYPQVEALIIDDGSDDTRQAVNQAFGGNGKVRYLHKTNGGVSSARNLGFREARGEFLAFLDSDDAWLPGKLTLQLECLRHFPEAGMVWSDMAAVDAQGKTLHERYLRKMYSTYQYFPTPRELFAHGLREARIGEVAAYCGDIFSPMVLGNVVHTSAVLLRSERREKAGFFDESFRTGEDYPFHLKTCSLGPVAYVDAVTLLYTIGAPDALTAPDKLIQISQVFLKTLETTLAREKDRIELPRELVRDRLADTYAWVGDEHLRAGQAAEARPYYIKSLSINPGQLAVLKALAKSFLPASVRDRLGELKRRIIR